MMMMTTTTTLATVTAMATAKVTETAKAMMVRIAAESWMAAESGMAAELGGGVFRISQCVDDASSRVEGAFVDGCCHRCRWYVVDVVVVIIRKLLSLASSLVRCCRHCR